MRYALLLHYAEPAEGEVAPEAIAAAQEAFGVYGRELAAAGVLVAAEVLRPQVETTTLTMYDGNPLVTDGPFAETKEALAGIFVIDVPDHAAALTWAEKCPGAQFGTVEIRPSATSCIDGAWT